MTRLLLVLLTLLFSLSGPAMGEYSDFGRWSFAAKGGAAPVRLGQAGESAIVQATGLSKNTTTYTVNGRSRIPDFVKATDSAGNPIHIIESKNVQYQSFTKQLRDYAELVGDGGRADIALPPGAKVSRQLQRAFDDESNPLFRYLMELPQ